MVSKEYYYANREKILGQAKMWRKKSYNKNKAAILSRTKKYHAEHREERNRKNRERSFIRRYGITLNERDKMILAQNGKCSICEMSFGGTNRPEVDHCHATGRIRGILCTFCNSLLGYAKDSEQILSSAKTYLANSKDNIDCSRL